MKIVGAIILLILPPGFYGLAIWSRDTAASDWCFWLSVFFASLCIASGFFVRQQRRSLAWAFFAVGTLQLVLLFVLPAFATAKARGEMSWPNHALEPTPVGGLSFAFAVDIIGPAWLSLGR